MSQPQPSPPPSTPAEVGLSRKDREAVAAQLIDSRHVLEEAVDGLTDVQWRYRAGPGSSSALDLVAHVAESETSLRATLEALAASQPVPADRRPKVRDLGVLLVSTNRDPRFHAGDTVARVGRDASPAEALRAFLRERARTIELVMRTSTDFRSLIADHAVLGPIDGVQWILFQAGHTDRHGQELSRARKGRAFPRGD